MRITNQQLNTAITFIVFSTIVASLITYCDKHRVPTCEEMGGKYELVRYEQKPFRSKLFYPVYKCELPNE